jgi:hypothetical protein
MFKRFFMVCVKIKKVNMSAFFYDKTLKVILIEFFIALMLALIQFSWGVGFLFGASTMLLNLILVEKHINQLLFNQKNSAFGNIAFYTFANSILGLPMLISVLYPNKSNLFAVAAGLLFYKYAFYVYEIFFKKENEK